MKWGVLALIELGRGQFNWLEGIVPPFTVVDSGRCDC